MILPAKIMSPPLAESSSKTMSLMRRRTQAQAGISPALSRCLRCAPVCGQASSPVFFIAPGRRTSFFVPFGKTEGDGAPKKRILVASSHTNQGVRRLSALHPDKLAPSGLIWRLFCPRVRVSWFMDRSGGPWRHPLVGGQRLGGPATIGPFPVQRAPRGVTVVSPDRLPGPPGSGVTSPARRRRIQSHLRNVSRRRPSVNRTL
jgi:hypothetical protein